MRPLRIEVEGFSAYRERVEVDFDGVDFFSLSGPTGSGKSSLVDAMIFALYGRVPRLGGNAVAPVITAGTDRARVRFFFEVDKIVYDATRMAQRTPSGGASVKEARLQEGENVLADGPGDVTAEVESILRLGFEDFTRTVVLPQGDFARFLQATKSERQGLLRNLLGLDVYTRMRELARTRAAVATERAESAQRSLENLDLADEETRNQAVAHLDSMEKLADELPSKEKGLSELTQAVVEAEAAQSDIEDAVTRLRAIVAPARLDDLESLSTQARSKVVDAGLAHESAVVALSEVEQAVAALPSGEQIASWSRTRFRLQELDVKLTTDGLEDAKKRLNSAESDLEKGLESLGSARQSSNETRANHAAHLLAESLNPGDPCPVCSQIVVDAPEVGELSGLAEIEAAEAEAEAQVSGLRKAVEEAKATVVGIEASRASLSEQQNALTADLEGAPDELEPLEAEFKTLTAEVAKTREALKVAETEVKAAQKELEDLADASRQLVKTLTEAQLSVADLKPHVSEADDVTVQWKELIQWRDQTLDRLTEERQSAAKTVIVSQTKADKARTEIVDDLRSHDIDVKEPFAVQVATALQTARSTVESHAKALENSKDLLTGIEEAKTTAAVAGALANHLKANGFEQWLMSGALAELVTGANDLLDQLSEGGYSLHSDESGSFSIVDHRNADEMRGVETLSGGETFLVSLALALSLAETLSAKGGSGLDAIILDEGFGSLDGESLDTVASVLEELTGKGLMVGVITHVKELAARAPVRYEVTRDPRGARVELAS